MYLSFAGALMAVLKIVIFIFGLLVTQLEKTL